MSKPRPKRGDRPPGPPDRPDLRLVGANDENPNLASALSYIARGWGVVALFHVLEPGLQPVCSCSKCACCPHPGKHPLYIRGTLENGANSATTDEAVVRQWWRRCPNANVGIATGRRWNLLVLDIDPRNGGDGTLDDLQARLGRLPDTVTSLTGGGGRHLLFQHPDFEVRGTLGSGVEILSDGRQFVAPESIHASGRAYAWELSSTPDLVAVAALPESWLTALRVAGADGEDGERRAGGEDGDSRDKHLDGGRGATPVAPVVPVVPEDPVDPVDPVTPLPGWTIERVFAAARVTGRAQHDTCTMMLARGLRHNLGFVNPEDARSHFDAWFAASQPHFQNDEYDSCWFKFLRAFDGARIALGAEGLAEKALAMAQGKPYPACAERVRQDKTKLLISMCREMAALAKGPFKLSSHQVARLFRVNPKSAHELLHGLQAILVLQCLDPGKPGRPGKNAATWRYIGDAINASSTKGGVR